MKTILSIQRQFFLQAISCHLYTCVNPANWSAIDFAPAPGHSNEVLAAQDGIAVQDYCAVRVTLDHGNGWYTGYYHLDGIPESLNNPVGQVTVSRGDLLGYASNRADCGGSSGTPHVHFTLRQGSRENHVRIWDRYIGGWQVKKGAQNREGTLERAGKIINRPRKSLYVYDPASGILNDGTKGANICSDAFLTFNGNYKGGVNYFVKSSNRILFNASLEDDEYHSEYGIEGAKIRIESSEYVEMNPYGKSDDRSQMDVRQGVDCGPIYKQTEHEEMAAEPIDEMPSKLNVNIYPNPNYGTFTIRFEMRDKADVSAKLFDNNGKLLKNIFNSRNLPAGEHLEMININDTSPGIYFIQLEIGEIREIRKIVML